MEPRSSPVPAIAALADAIAIVVFVVIGRRSHDEANAFRATVDTAAPFLIGAAVGWLVARAHRAPLAHRTALVVWISTVAVGMVVRRLVFDDGTAPSFVVVATIVLGLFLVGWRAVARRWLGRPVSGDARPQPSRPQH